MTRQELSGSRLDSAVALRQPDLSRSRIRRLIEAGWITVSGVRVKVAYRLRSGDRVEGRVPAPEPLELRPEPIPLDVVYQDASLIVVDKPAGMVVHPAAGRSSGTLVHALLHHCDDLSGIGGMLRPGIVHRLDKGTSGLLVVAKSDAAHRALSAQFKCHSVDREYLALVRGAPKREHGSVDAAIGRHPGDRKRFSTRARSGRRAVTHWSVEARFAELTLLRVRLETGRTHQIRVHLTSIGLPVVGDPVYGGGRVISRALGLERQALHAAVLGFDPPEAGARLRFESPLPADLRCVIAGLGP